MRVTFAMLALQLLPPSTADRESFAPRVPTVELEKLTFWVICVLLAPKTSFTVSRKQLSVLIASLVRIVRMMEQFTLIPRLVPPVKSVTMPLEHQRIQIQAITHQKEFLCSLCVPMVSSRTQPLLRLASHALLVTTAPKA